MTDKPEPQDQPPPSEPSSVEPEQASAAQTADAEKSSGLSTGAMIAIGIGVVAIVGLIIWLLVNMGGAEEGGSSSGAAPATPPPGSGGSGIIIVIPTPVPGAPSVTANTAINIRGGPGTDYPIVGLLNQSETASVVGRSEDGAWWAVNVPTILSQIGWVFGELVTPSNADSVPVIPAPPLPTATVAPPVTITEWKGEYFNNRELSGEPVLVRNDSEINFNWGSGSPAPEVPVDNFSVRWTQNFDVQAGVYRYSVWVDDGMRLWIDEALVINAWTEGPVSFHTADVELTAGAHSFRVEYFEASGGAMISLAIGYLGEVAPQPQPPVAVITGPTQATVGEPLLFSAAGSSVSAGSHIALIEWDFGDDTTGSGNPVEHTYTEPGVYAIAMLLTDDKGLTGSSQQQIRVEEGEPEVPTAEPTPEAPEVPTEVPTEEPPVTLPPVAGIVAPQQGAAGEPIVFDGTTSTASSEITTYQWDFGDGEQGDGALVEHVYAAPGVYEATLTITAADGQTGASTWPIEILPSLDAAGEGEAESTPAE